MIIKVIPVGQHPKGLLSKHAEANPRSTLNWMPGRNGPMKNLEWSKLDEQAFCIESRF